MTPEEEKTVDKLLDLVSSQERLINDLRIMNEELTRQNFEILAQLEAVRAIAKAKL